MRSHIRIQHEDFEFNEEIEALTAGDREMGAVANFVGLVRDDDGLVSLSLEHYPGMTEREIARHASEAASRWPLGAITIIHRVGRLVPGDRIVLVAVASKHRAAAFEACEFLIDYMKTRAPFWKEEERSGARAWVEARRSDDSAAERWRR
jgi:molybdopterin synthase catalytic subunit